MLSHPLQVFGQTSLSDFSTDLLQGKKTDSEQRNPFSPGATEATPDASILSLEGIIVGPDAEVGLISGRILREGQQFGNFIVKDIKRGSAMVLSTAGEHLLTMEGFLPPLLPGSQYDIIFHNADLKDALRMLASAGKFNIIIPEGVSGRLSMALSQTPLRDALGSMLRVNGLEFAAENNIVRVGKPAEFAAGAFFSSKTINLRFATAKDLLETVKAHLSDKGTVTQDARTNSIIVKDSDAVIQNVESLIAKLDRQDTQVHIEAKIVDVSRSFSRSLGIQWGFTRPTGRVIGFGGPNVGTVPNGTGNPLNVDLPVINPTSGFGILVGNIFGNGTNLEAQITAAEDRGDAHIISQPSITTVNNTPAKIRSGVKIYVKTTSTIAVGGSSGSTSASDSGLNEIDTGIELTVTPQITIGDTIKLKIDAQESEADFSKTVDGIPSVIDNTATTTVVVKDGETTVIGGLMKIKKSNTVNAVPFASSIPVVGWLFKSKTRSKADNELLIFITPHIRGHGGSSSVAGTDPNQVSAPQVVTATSAKTEGPGALNLIQNSSQVPHVSGDGAGSAKPKVAKVKQVSAGETETRQQSSRPARTEPGKSRYHDLN